jgi:transposase
VGTGTEQLTVLADRGYFKSEEIRRCHEAGMMPIVPKTVTSNATAAGRFGKAHFIYDETNNEYRCPAGQSLTYRSSRIEDGLKVHRYWSSSCRQCAIKTKCTPASYPLGTRRCS